MDGSCVFPSSFAQQRLWFLDRLIPGHAFYNIHFNVPLNFYLAPGVLRETLREIVSRHETLRTTFAVEGGVPVQVVSAAGGDPLRVDDLCHLPPEGRPEAALRLAAEQAAAPFNLE